MVKKRKNIDYTGKKIKTRYIYFQFIREVAK